LTDSAAAMLFDAYVFIFVFLPVTLAGFSFWPVGRLLAGRTRVVGSIEYAS